MANTHCRGAVRLFRHVLDTKLTDHHRHVAALDMRFGHHIEVHPMFLDSPAPTASRDMPRPFQSVDEIFDVLRDLGRQRFVRPGVTHWQHAYRTAALAREAGACDALITAALLHDLGDLSIDSDVYSDDASLRDHAALGAHLLGDLFPAVVTETIRLHAAGHRYRAAQGRAQLGQLSDEGCWHAQLDPMSRAERKAFAARPFAGYALQLCAWDQDASRDQDVGRWIVRMRRSAELTVCNDDFDSHRQVAAPWCRFHAAVLEAPKNPAA